MSVSQAEFVASKAETAERLKKMEEVITQTIEDVKKLQDATDLISIQSAPWSVSIETAVAASEAKAQSALTEVRSLYEGTKAEVEDLRRRATEVEKRSSGEKKQKWELSRPKDIEPDVFGAKEEAWSKFKDGLTDYAEAVHPGLREQLEWAAKQKEPTTHEVMQRSDAGCTAEEWLLRVEIYKLLKRKTETGTEARKFVECVEKEDGYEAWRLLCGRYEANSGTKRFAMLAELTNLQNKRCKNAAETAMIVLEIDRRKRMIVDIGGKVPDADVCQNVLWMSMDPSTRAHVTGKVNMDTVDFAELRQVVQAFCNLVASTSSSGKGGGVAAMDIGSIANAPGTLSCSVVSDWGTAEAEDQSAPQTLWSLDESGWPIDEEGWPLVGELVPQSDGQLNFVKGGAKGKGKGK